MKNKLFIGVHYDATVLEKTETYSDIGFWTGNVKIDLPETNYIQKLLLEDGIKELTEKMAIGKKYKINIEISEL